MGVDLGQSLDPSALSVVERTYDRRRPLRFRVLYLERVRKAVW